MPTTSAPAAFASSATIGQIPVPEPPPSPLAMNTKSAPETIRLIISRPASAQRRPVDGSPPAPSPRVM